MDVMSRLDRRQVLMTGPRQCRGFARETVIAP